MVDQAESRPSPLRWDPIQKIYIEVHSMQHARELDELNEQIENDINDENEYEMSLNNKEIALSIVRNDGAASERPFPLSDKVPSCAQSVCDSRRERIAFRVYTCIKFSECRC